MARISGSRILLLPVVVAMVATLGALATLWAIPGQTLVAATTITVTTTDDDTIVNGNCTLREAIIAANTDTAVDNCPAGMSGADTINLAAGVYTIGTTGNPTDTPFIGDFDITDDLNINGADQAITIIDGAGIARVFELFLGATVTMDGVTIQNGNAGFESPKDGGGILNNPGGRLTLTNSS